MTKKQQLKEILQYIPSGAQTLSKYPTQFVRGVTPVAVTKGKGAYFWDKENKKYLDLVMALGPSLFGYAHPTIDRAVIRQLHKGTIFSLPSELELKLAKLLKKVIPCAEMSRFVLDGNDATTGAIRLARHITKRDHIAKCGYHGYQDWSICTKNGRNAGVPTILKTLTHDFEYDHIDSLKKIFTNYPGQIAAVIIEPMFTDKAKDNFLAKAKKIAKDHGALFILDEMVTGFRLALGGAQEYFKVTPDLACFGKAIANGYPLSVICGKKEFMEKMDEIFVSTTFSGFTLGLAAALATIELMIKTKKFHLYIRNLGSYFIEKSNAVFQKHNTPAFFTGYGTNPILKINIGDDYTARVIKTFIYEGMNKAGIFFSFSIDIGYIHQKKDIDRVVKVLDKTCQELSRFSGNYEKAASVLEGQIVAPRLIRQT